MSTAASTTSQPHEPRLIHTKRAVPFEERVEPSFASRLTIHRITNTHHGRTLLMLGHAAEHLVSSRGLQTTRAEGAADIEAVHILMRLSREVFDEYAGESSRSRRLERWITDGVIRVIC